MKTRHLFALALAALPAYLVGAGCTQDFNVFQPCGADEKVCDDGCVAVTEPAYGCVADGCDPCNLPNATAACTGTVCAIAACAGTFENCDGSSANGCEADPTSDPSHCGACGNACVTPHAQPGCNAGSCTVGACEVGWEDCDGMVANGCEVNTQSDPASCGGCNSPCGQFESCQAGQCVLDCDPGFGNCDMDPSNGCETMLGTTTHCGSCGDACDLANATAACSAGACVIQTCFTGWGDCNAVDADGCEADLRGSAMTCGACNNACPAGINGTSFCDNGQCALNCNAGFGDCDGDVATGCETDVNASIPNCGGCNQACNPANGTGTCNNGTCQLLSCTAPFDDCDGMAANGCEVNLQTSPASCGACGMTCSLPNAVAACNNGACTVGSCNAGFGNCDGLAANGCETSTTNDVSHCGTCNFPCSNAPNATAACANGTCGLSCNAGFSDCNNNPADGCEVATASNVNHCGQCGRACAGFNVASKSCSYGVCDSSCALGFANCFLPAAPSNDDGCENGVTTDSADCGGCGNDCGLQGNPANAFECDGGSAAQKFCGCSQSAECSAGASGSCTGGLCSCNAITCQPGEACGNVGGLSACTCNGAGACLTGETCCQTPAGCVNLDTSPQNCGACGHACPPGFVCFDPGVFQPPECRCNEAADCNAGTGGTFSCNANGRCVCGANTCSTGQRCQANGQCG